MNSKLIKTLLIIFFIAIFVASLFVSQDEHHLESCNDDHCFYCAMIHVAQNIITLIFALIINVSMIGVLIFYFLSRFHNIQVYNMKSSLVFQKVQFNE